MFPKEPGKQQKRGNKFHRGDGNGGTSGAFAESVAAALKAELGATPHAVKTVMAWTGASDRTVKHWFAGSHGPSGEHLVDLVRNSDKVLQAILVLADRDMAALVARIVALRKQLVEVVDYIDERF